MKYDPKKLKAICMDFDGTIVNSIDVMCDAYKLFLSKFNLKYMQNEFDEFNGPTLAHIINILKKRYGLKESHSNLLDIYNSIIDKSYNLVKPNNYVKDFINEASYKSIVLVVVTSNKKKRVEKWLLKNQLRKNFKFIISAEDVLQGKPNPEPYLNAIKKLNLPNKNIIAVEDSLKGLNSALSANLYTFFLNSRLQKLKREENNMTSIRTFNCLKKFIF